MEDNKVYRLNRWGNVITKTKADDGAWVYSIWSREGMLLGTIVFDGRKSEHGSITNGDLLEIVRDRLDAYNRSKFASRRTQCAEDRVTEAIVWAEHSALRKIAHIPETASEIPDTAETAEAGEV